MTTLAISFQHLFIVLIILGLLVALPAYLILKVQKSNRKEEQLLSNLKINDIGTEEQFSLNLDEDTEKKLKKYGSISQKLNLLIYISALLILAFLSLISSSKNIQNNSGGAEMFGAVIGAIVAFIILGVPFTLMFNPIKKLYKRYLLFSTGSIDYLTFTKFKKSSKIWTVIFSIISVLILNSIGYLISESPIFSLLGIALFILLMLPHYIFSSNLKKI